MGIIAYSWGGGLSVWGTIVLGLELITDPFILVFKDKNAIELYFYNISIDELNWLYINKTHILMRRIQLGFESQTNEETVRLPEQKVVYIVLSGLVFSRDGT